MTANERIDPCANGHDFMAPAVVRTESRYFVGRGRAMEQAVSFCRRCGKRTSWGWQPSKEDA